MSATSTTTDTAFVCLQNDTAFAGLPEPLRSEAERQLQRQPVVRLASLGQLPARSVVVGQRPAADDAVAWRRRGGALARSLAGDAPRRVDLALPDDPLAERLLCGFHLGSYRFERYKPEPVSAWKLHVTGLSKRAAGAAARLAERLALCRDLVNTPAGDLGPAQFVAAARRAIRGTGLRLRLLSEADCARREMGCLLAVGRAAARDRRPRLLVLEWPGTTGKGRKSRSARPLALCGKGVCFDTGGLQIKSHDGMKLMRKDMGGAATVLAAMLALADAGGARPVRAYLPLVENAIDGGAMRPGDVLTASDGTTVEVGHTDAEGRLILADAIALARREGAGAIVTVATLTGAALYALGRIHVPVMGSDQALVDQLTAAAAAAGEKVWQLPLDEDHRRLVQRSELAQLTNSAGPDAGCITAGAFLAHFAGPLPFAHCDISPASFMPAEHELGPVGATGVLVETLLGLALGG